MSDSISHVIVIDPQVHRAVSVKHALLLYHRTNGKLKAGRSYTSTNMLRATLEITGKKFKRGQYKEAAEALDQWLIAYKANRDNPQPTGE